MDKIFPNCDDTNNLLSLLHDISFKTRGMHNVYISIIKSHFCSISQSIFYINDLNIGACLYYIMYSIGILFLLLQNVYSYLPISTSPLAKEPASVIAQLRQVGESWSYSQLINNVNSDSVDAVSFITNTNDVIAIDKRHLEYLTPENLHKVHLVPGTSDMLLNYLSQHNVAFDVMSPSEFDSIWNMIIGGGINIVFYILGITLVTSIVRGIFGGRNPMGGPMIPGVPNVNSADIVDTKSLNTTFVDVAGCDEAKFELVEVVDFLKYPERYAEAGAKIPKGVLLEGSPGTGKTLLARAVAGEAGVPFISVSGSEFIEMFVGVGAARVRTLFEKARSNSPCVVFIDEIDAIGRQRGTGIAGGNDEREQTLNQILTNMDGFTESQGIVIIAATNRADILDNALVRPGRFDRKVRVPLPDYDGRKAIADVHFRNKNTDNLDFDELSSLTTGFSGADIANLANEAAIFSVRRNQTLIDRSCLMDAYEKITIGIPYNRNETNSDIIDLVSHHECGHALMAALFDDFFNVRKVTIQANSAGAGGYTLFTPKEKYNQYATKKFILANLIVSLGGRAAEVYMTRKKRNETSFDDIVFRGFKDLDITTGATNDLYQANNIARNYVIQYGFSDSFGVYDEMMNSNLPFVGKEMGTQSPKLSEQSKENVDTEVKKLVDFAYNKALELIYIHETSFIDMVKLLYNKKVIDGQDIINILDKSI